MPLAGSYVQLVEDQPGGLGVIALPHLDAGPFLSYGIQWIAFGIMAPILLGYFVYAEIRQRRREKAAASDADATAPLTDRAEARRPIRPAALRQTATTAACDLHDSRQPHRPREIRDLGRPPVAERRPDLQFVCVLRRPAEPYAKRAGEGGLHHTRVGAGVTGRVAAPRTQRFGG